MSKKDFSKLIWIPQILAAAYAVFLVYFWEKASLNTSSFVTELLPSLIILAILALTWKKSEICGIFFVTFALAFAVYFVFAKLTFDNVYIVTALMAGFPAIIGILFLIFAKKKVPAEAPAMPKEAEKTDEATK